MAQPEPRGNNLRDPHTLLCERCGYVVEGLPAAGVCPECGLTIAQSHPAHRVGTPWQQRPGLGAMLRTCLMTLRRPRRTLGVIAASPPPFRALLALAGLPWGLLAGVALLASLSYTGPVIPSALVTLAIGTVLGLLLTPAAASVLAALTWIEARGLIIFSAQRGGRVDAAWAHTIVRHGAAGWLIAGLGAAMMLPLAWSLEPAVGWFLAHPKDGAPRAWAILLAAAGVPVALAGFLWFEFFAWLGLRRCAFANRTRAHEPAHFKA